MRAGAFAGHRPRPYVARTNRGRGSLVLEFKAFVMRGNLLELAVAFIMGLAFAGVVTSFTNDIIGGILGMLFGEPNFGSVVIRFGGGTILIGSFINAVVNFVIVAFVLFLVIKAYNRMQKPKAEEAAVPSQVELLTEIRDALRSRDTHTS
jgi:large conductance mechanosensitive channel